MYGLGRFNLARFNLTGGGDDLPGKAESASQIDALIAVSQDAESYSTGFGAVNGYATFAPAIFTEALGVGAIQQAAELLADAPVEYNGSSMLLSSGHGSVTSYSGAQNASIIGGLIKSSLDSISSRGAASALEMACHSAINSYVSGLLAFALIGGEVDVNTFALGWIELLTPIPPGGRLILDSEHYTATLDAVNALHYLIGDWLRLERETFDVVIDAASVPNGAPGIDAKILYTERWL